MIECRSKCRAAHLARWTRKSVWTSAMTREISPGRGSVVRYVPGRPTRLHDGPVAADTDGTHSTRAECVLRACGSGYQRSVWRAARGRLIQTGMTTHGRLYRSLSGRVRAEIQPSPQHNGHIDRKRMWLGSGLPARTCVAIAPPKADSDHRTGWLPQLRVAGIAGASFSTLSAVSKVRNNAPSVAST